ncbi:hypothetical protein [Acinetobacter sp. YH12063]|uniref:hypothetical protein n=1 Tax=Acinetobacter sp. YH12063 TaxID=2601061 RepID=UPI0015D44179|nr:hypothetical protein [Acinetobacter sp. YH12063]
MGKSKKQVTGHRYYANLLLFIGNPIEKVLGINFDKRGWISPFVDENGNPLAQGIINKPFLYGENEGGVAGTVHVQYGRNDQEVLPFYKSYMESKGLPASSFPFQSYLAFTGIKIDFSGIVGGIAGSLLPYSEGGFYLGNSGYMKEMLLWVKRIHVRNDGRTQWYDEKAEIGTEHHSGDSSILLPEGFHYFSTKTVEKYSYWDNENITTSETGEYNTKPDRTSAAMQYFGALAIGVSIYNTDQEEYFGGEHYTYFEINNFPNVGIATATYQLRVAAKNFSKKWTVLSPEALLYDRKISTVIDGVYRVETYEVAIDLSKASFIKFEIGCSGGVLLTNGSNTIYAGTDIAFDVKADLTWFSFDSGDINPIHKIREILTDDTAMSKPESDVNNVNFMKAADRIWDEGLGISWSITEKSCLEAINELCGHIEAGVRVNRQTGLYEMVLFRDDWFEESEIHTIAINKIKSMSLEVANADEGINQLNVSYYNRDAIKDSSFSIAENASIRNLNGRVNAEDADFPYFMNQRNAAVVSQWKLKQMSSPVWKGSFTTAEYNARKWNRYDLLKLAWPRKWQGEITVRIMKINLGKGADVSIDFVEVVPYSSHLWSDVVIDEPIDVGVQPPLACPYEPFEMPYYLAVMALGQRQVDEELSYENNFGLVGVVAEQPQSNSLYAVMMTHDGTEGEEWLRAATINYEPVAELDQIISRTSTNFTVKDSAAISGLPIGTLIKCGSDWIGTPGEWMVFIGIDPYTGVVSVKRGALDSLPQEWGAGTKLYFCGNDVAYDSTEYVAGEEVLVSALTTTPSGMLENKGSIAIEMNARAIRPYPPANVKFNGNYFPETHVISNDILLTWAHRNRAQQTGGEIIGWFDNGVTLENGVTYSLELSTVQDGIIHSAINISSGSYTIPASVLLQNKAHKLKLWSLRDGFKSYQIFEHNFFVESVSLVLTATLSKDKVIGSTVPAASISVNVDESLKVNMRFDGSSISGKADPGATITIEIEE